MRRQTRLQSQPQLQAPPAGLPADAPTPAEETVDAQCGHFAGRFRDEPYYSSGRAWKDYAPAYRYAFRSFRLHGRRAFEDIERELEQEWPMVREQSRLTWAEARQAMIAAWQHARSDAGLPAAEASPRGQ